MQTRPFLADTASNHFLLQHVRVRLTAEFPRQLERCIDLLNEEDIWWRPHEQANAIGNLVLHLAGSNLFYLAHVIGGAPDNRNRAAEFAARADRTKAEVLSAWRAATEKVTLVLDSLTADRLTEVTSDRNRCVAEVLLHVTHHNALHLGQIVWISKLRRPGVIEELLRGPSAWNRR